MDLNSVSTYRRATTRDDLVLAPGEAVLAGGTWLFSEELPQVTGLVDLTSFGWEPIERTTQGLRIAATCTIAQLVEFARNDAEWTAAPLFAQAAHALLASFKVWNTATVGGNIAQSYAAGAMISMASGLDAEALIWTPDGGERRMPVAAVPTGNGTNSLAPGEVIRAIDLPEHALRSRTTLRKEALADHGRSGAVVTGRLDRDGAAVFTVTAATLTPHVLRFAALPSQEALAAAVDGLDGRYSDPLGAADWRRAVTVVLAERARRDLAEGSDGAPAASDPGSRAAGEEPAA